MVINSLGFLTPSIMEFIDFFTYIFKVVQIITFCLYHDC
jgi:hypothetical protein